MTPQIHGPIVRPDNPVADAVGSIHDDDVARKLGFRGGTIPGDALMDLYPGFLAQHFGRPWFERGTLSLYFRLPLEGGDPVRAILEKNDDEDGSRAAAGPFQTRLVTPDERVVAEGTVSIGETLKPSALFARDLRAVEPDQLRILAQMVPGETIATHRVELTTEQQLNRIARGFGGQQSEAEGDVEDEVAHWHRTASPWGAAIALPSTAIGLLLYRGPRVALTPRIGDSVGLFGAIELRHQNGPIQLDQSYDVNARVVALSESPKTESMWFDSVATTPTDPDTPVASMRMMLRFMKASSPLY